MNKVAKFKKVSFEQFKKDCENYLDASEEYIRMAYDAIKIPQRATKGSAGYDIRTPVGFYLYPGKQLIIPTGLRCEIEDGWFLSIVPRSGIGFKHGIRLANTVGIIDSDYEFADNEGHILINLRYPTQPENVVFKSMVADEGDRICQGIFVPYGITKDDNIDAVRYGGFGSTGN